MIVRKQGTPKRQNEHYLQRECVKWFRFVHSQHSMLLFAIPNGGARSKATAGKLKAEGVVRGVADLFLAVPNRKYHGFFIEMKYGKNNLTADQIEFRNKVVKQGYKHSVCRSTEQFIHELTHYINDKTE